MNITGSLGGIYRVEIILALVLFNLYRFLWSALKILIFYIFFICCLTIIKIYNIVYFSICFIKDIFFYNLLVSTTWFYNYFSTSVFLSTIFSWCVQVISFTKELGICKIFYLGFTLLDWFILLLFFIFWIWFLILGFLIENNSCFS